MRFTQTGTFNEHFLDKMITIQHLEQIEDIILSKLDYNIGFVTQEKSEFLSEYVNNLIGKYQSLVGKNFPEYNSKIIGDMPINTYNTPEQAVENAKKFIEAGAHAVKIEGNKPDVINAIIKEGITVMAHLGLLPQTAAEYKVQGKDAESAEMIYNDALEVDKLGVFAMVLECIPCELAKRITENTKNPTIGIGAGPDCNGQVLVVGA